MDSQNYETSANDYDDSEDSDFEIDDHNDINEKVKILLHEHERHHETECKGDVAFGVHDET